MRRLLLKVLVATALLASHAVLFEAAARRMYRTGTDLSFKIAAFERTLGSTEILILGNSHMEKSVDPALLPWKAFNLAFSGQDHYYDAELFRRYSPRMPALRCVVLGVDLWSLGYDLSASSPTTVLDYLDVCGIPPRLLGPWELLPYRFKLWTHRLTFLPDLVRGKRPAPLDTRDSLILDVPVPDQREVLLGSGYRYISGTLEARALAAHAVERSRFHAGGAFDPALVADNVRRLRGVIDACRRRGIAVMVVSPPVTGPYAAGFGEEFRARRDAERRSLIGDLPDVVWLDCERDPRFGDADFCNADHLNAHGAARFTAILAERLPVSPLTPR